MAGITCGDVTGKDGAWTRHLVRCGGGDSAVRLERSRLRLRRAFRVVSNSKAGVGSMVGEPSTGRESAALHVTARPEASKASAASRAAEREKGPQREVPSTSGGGAEGGKSSSFTVLTQYFRCLILEIQPPSPSSLGRDVRLPAF